MYEINIDGQSSRKTVTQSYRAFHLAASCTFLNGRGQAMLFAGLIPFQFLLGVLYPFVAEGGDPPCVTG